jgi:hypothetical protein
MLRRPLRLPPSCLDRTPCKRPYLHDEVVFKDVGRLCSQHITCNVECAHVQDLDRYAPEPEVHKYLHSRYV